MTNEEAIEVLRTSSWMCLSNNSIKFQKAIEYAYNNLKRIEKKSEENTKLKTEIEQLQSTNAELCEEIAELEKLIPRICETCKYEDLAGTEEPCENCKHCSSWKMKGGTEWVI